MVFVTRALTGIGDCAQAVCYTIATDIAVWNKEEVTNAYGLISSMMGLGFVIGPLIGGVLCEVSVKLCLLVSTVVATVGVLLSYLLLEESLHYTTSQHTTMDGNTYISPTDTDDSVLSHTNTTTSTSSTAITIDNNNNNTSTSGICSECSAYWQKVNPMKPLIVHFSNLTIRWLSYHYILSSLVDGLGFIWYIYMAERYHASATAVGIYLAFFGVVSMLV
jgi:MFS family permease